MGLFGKKPPQTKAEKREAERRGRAARTKRNQRLERELARAERRQTADERSHGVKPRRPRMW